MGIRSLASRITGEYYLDRKTNRRFEWVGGGERVVIFWMSGAADHSGWSAEVKRDDVNLQLANGFVDFNVACYLADCYMTDSYVETGIQQNKVDMAQRAANHEFEIVEPSDLHPSAPVLKTPRDDA